MGNVPAKEAGRHRSSSEDDGRRRSSSNVVLPSASSFNGMRKKKKDKDKAKQQQKEQHVMDLIVRYDESVDGGYLAPYGTYKQLLDYKTDIVKDLIVKRKLSPFYTPLQDFDPEWTDDELLDFINKTPLHAPPLELDEEEDVDDHKLHQSMQTLKRRENKKFKELLKQKGIEWQNEAQKQFERHKQIQKQGIKTYDQLPSDDLLLTLYRNATECPICFLYYPQNLNLSRCCIQPICTECFVQMKRQDPHPPHDEEGVPVPEDQLANPQDLISEPVKCPFCAMPDFGVTYTPLGLRTGIGGVLPSNYRANEAIIEDESFEPSHKRGSSMTIALAKSHSGMGTPPRSSFSYMDRPVVTRKRRGSLPANAPGVITIDFIRPDWEAKLISARAKLARRSAAASAIHATSLIMDSDSTGNLGAQNTSRSGFRRGLVSRFHSRANSQDIEDRLVEEAMRLSLLEEEERRLREKNKASS